MIVSVLEAMAIVLWSSNFFVVAGIDRKRIMDAVTNHYSLHQGKKLIEPLPDNFAAEFLKKIFQARGWPEINVQLKVQWTWTIFPNICPYLAVGVLHAQYNTCLARNRL